MQSTLLLNIEWNINHEKNEECKLAHEKRKVHSFLSHIVVHSQLVPRGSLVGFPCFVHHTFTSHTEANHYDVLPAFFHFQLPFISLSAIFQPARILYTEFGGYGTFRLEFEKKNKKFCNVRGYDKQSDRFCFVSNKINSFCTIVSYTLFFKFWGSTNFQKSSADVSKFNFELEKKIYCILSSR